ncbi:chloride channel protein [Streptococcus cuniculipharyngis]|uniref:Chloride channel protein n=1 Tax=Streptococcus cuniculipharyngis TaxID=1562651 RepID=A0A5C5SCY2_9STRE|nr:chloride channel protein [Streptococcus cuniculipharyngis]TWS98040.1 hypothetical protein FRX57_03680 [Streptococcus cuniculipharyngis]
MTTKTYGWRLLGITLVSGVLTGLVAIGLHDLLKLIQELVYGYTDGQFLILAKQISPLRRALVLILAGPLVAVCWYFLQKKAPLLSIKGQIAGLSRGTYPRFWQHLGHGLTQILAVGMGVPVGKEVAPRELAALLAGKLSRARLSRRDQEVLLAAAAAAGLSAVYQTPIASMFFLFEGMKAPKNWRSLSLGLIMITTATWVANLGIAAKPTYQVTQLDWAKETWVIAVLLGLLLPPLALWFKQGVQRVQASRVKDGKIFLWLTTSMVLVALLALGLPEILGNGRDAVQAAFLGLSWSYALALLVIKTLVVLLALKSGAYGGTLTPGFALGALLGLLLATGLVGFLPDLSLPMASVIGAGTFLSVSMGTPLTAIFLTMTFTGQSYLSLLPLALSVGLATLVTAIMTKN